MQIVTAGGRNIISTQNRVVIENMNMILMRSIFSVYKYFLVNWRRQQTLDQICILLLTMLLLNWAKYSIVIQLDLIIIIIIY